MHHKRHRPKNRRAGCLLCKPWKVNSAKTNGRDTKRLIADLRRMQDEANAGSWRF
jgi:hypothetical protein